MGRKAVRDDLRRRPRSFALSVNDDAFIDVYAEAHDLSRSQALRRMLVELEERMPGEFRREVALRRRAMGEEARARELAEEERRREVRIAACPQCGDADLYVPLPNGRWRCDNCMAAG